MAIVMMEMMVMAMTMIGIYQAGASVYCRDFGQGPEFTQNVHDIVQKVTRRFKTTRMHAHSVQIKCNQKLKSCVLLGVIIKLPLLGV